MDNYIQELQLLADKVDGSCDESWQEIAEQLQYPYSVDTLRKSLNGQYGGASVYKYFLEHQDKYASDEQIKKFEQLKDELYKERCKLNDKLNENRGQLREQARYENLVEVLKEKLDDFEPIKFDFDSIGVYGSLGNTTKWACLQLSDWHCGALIDNQWNYYDIEEMKYRANIIIDKCIKNCIKQNVNNLVVEINGDMVHGIINTSNRVDSEESVIEQIIIVSEILAQCINKLRPYFNEIKIVATLGNHGRIIGDKKQVNTKENFEMLIPEFLRLRLNMPIISSQGLDFVKYEIDDKIILCSHGQNDNLNNVISDFSKMYKLVPDEIHLGHTHSYKDINDCDIMVTVNGSLQGTDDYAIRCRKNTNPSQNLIIYDDDRFIIPLRIN